MGKDRNNCVNKPSTLFKLLIPLLLIAYAQAGNYKPSDTMLPPGDEFSKSLAMFAINMYHKLLLLKPNENIVFSPFSIQTCVAMARIGAEGETAAEIDRGLGLLSSDALTMAKTFNRVLALYEKSNILKIANKIYVMKGYTVNTLFNEIISEQFFSTADQIDFAKNVEAAETINHWVESKTNNLIKDLIAPQLLSADTRLVLLNAIYFKGEWVHKFRKHDTHNEEFYLNESDTVQVPMMNVKERFRYADLPDLDATALEMPYRNSDLSMLIILPNSRTGLKSLENKLQNIQLADISKRMSPVQVIVKLPKFKADFSIELNEPLKQMGMTRMFTLGAEFGKMLESTESLLVSKVVHKAFIEVNEEGTEAAAATAVVMRMKRSIGNLSEPKEFIAEHPFFYAINHATSGNRAGENDDKTSSNSPKIPFFMGTIVKFDNVKHLHEEL